MRSRQTIINNLLEANEALESDIYTDMTLQNTTFLYVDKLNGNDDSAAQYFIDNPLVLNNKTSPFASYAGINGMVEFWEARKAAADARFVDNWPVFIDLSKNVAWNDVVPSNSIGSSEKRLVWCSFNQSNHKAHIYNTYLYLITSNEVFLNNRGATENANYGYDHTAYFYSHLQNIVIGHYSGNGRTNTEFYKISAYKFGIQGRMIDKPYPYGIKINRCVFYEFRPYMQSGMLWKTYTRSFLLLKNSIIVKHPDWEGYIDIAYSGGKASHNLSSGDIRTHNHTSETVIFGLPEQIESSQAFTDPQFVDVDSGILYVKPTSPSVKTGENQQDIGLGVGHVERKNDNMSAAIARGELKNLTIEANGKLSVTHTAQQVSSIASNIITLDASAPSSNAALDGLVCRLVSANESLREEIPIVSYNGTSKELTLASTPVNTIDETWTYYISAELESTLIDYTLTADTLQVSEDREHDANGFLLRGVYETHLKMCLREELEAGRIPTSGDSKYIASKHDYKKMQPDYVRIDKDGFGSADIGFDDSTAQRPFSEYQQIKLKMW